jgi:hypothetical protein
MPPRLDVAHERVQPQDEQAHRLAQTLVRRRLPALKNDIG